MDQTKNQFWILWLDYITSRLYVGIGTPCWCIGNLHATMDPPMQCPLMGKRVKLTLINLTVLPARKTLVATGTRVIYQCVHTALSKIITGRSYHSHSHHVFHLVGWLWAWMKSWLNSWVLDMSMCPRFPCHRPHHTLCSSRSHPQPPTPVAVAVTQETQETEENSLWPMTTLIYAGLNGLLVLFISGTLNVYIFSFNIVSVLFGCLGPILMICNRVVA